MGKLFGTDGVRGIANTELTNELAYKLGRFGAHVITGGRKDAKMLVAKDTRVSGDMLEAAMVSGILSAGVDVIRIGVLPTPALAHLVRDFSADAGVMISASHNPVAYNGIKFFNEKGLKLTDAIEEEIEAFILEDKDLPHIPVGTEIGRETQVYEAEELYTQYLIETIDVDFKGLSVALDGANGAASDVAPHTMHKLGAKVKSLHTSPDGFNINENCGSTHPGDLIEVMKAGGYDIGLAFDGDADRLIAVDEKGELVDGDKIMAICARHLKEKGLLKENTVVATVMSNLGFQLALKREEIDLEITQVGDRYVLERMLEGGFSIGGEQSGHIIFLDHNTTGDGLLSALQLMAVMKETGKPLSELARIMDTYPQVLQNARVTNQTKHSYTDDVEIQAAIQKVEAHYAGEGRVLIRPSGTEPLVRVMIEGKDLDQMNQHAGDLVALIEKRLG